MMEKVVEKLDCINQTLERQNRIIQQMLDVMPRPENKFVRALEVIGLSAGALSILGVVDIIRHWIIGG